MAPPPDNNAALQAIISAPEHQLRATLKAVCTGDAKILGRVWTVLNKVRSFESRNLKRKADGIHGTANGGGKRAKIVEDIHHCVRCGKVFFEAENNNKACLYHPEPELQLDDDDVAWLHWDVRSRGPRDTPDTRRNYPQGFVFYCCEQDARSKGCKVGNHWAADDPRGEPFETDSLDEGDEEDEEDEIIEISSDEDEEDEEDEDEEEEEDDDEDEEGGK